MTIDWKLVLRDSNQLNAGQQLYVKDFIENLLESLIEDIPEAYEHTGNYGVAEDIQIILRAKWL